MSTSRSTYVPKVTLALLTEFRVLLVGCASSGGRLVPRPHPSPVRSAVGAKRAAIACACVESIHLRKAAPRPDPPAGEAGRRARSSVSWDLTRSRTGMSIRLGSWPLGVMIHEQPSVRSTSELGHFTKSILHLCISLSLPLSLSPSITRVCLFTAWPGSGWSRRLPWQGQTGRTQNTACPPGRPEWE